MTRTQLEHILRAAGSITGCAEFVVIGSQAVLGSVSNPPDALLVSIEADLFTLRDPADADAIDGAIGELSSFHQTFGYYAHGVGRDTATLPIDWESRLVPLRSTAMPGVTGFCLELHDLAVAKLVAGRAKDIDYVVTLAIHRLIDLTTVAARLSNTPLEPAISESCVARLARVKAAVAPTEPRS